MTQNVNIKPVWVYHVHTNLELLKDFYRNFTDWRKRIAIRFDIMDTLVPKLSSQYIKRYV